MARPRKQTYTMQQYIENVREGYITNDADTQRFPATKAIVDGLAVTILTDDYIPPIILAEEDNGQMRITDGGSRTAAFKMILLGNYKIKSSVENPIIQYKSMSKNEYGEIEWTDAEFDIRNKTFEQFPKELQKKFNEYQVETVIHEHCDSNKVAMYIKRYNEHTAMNANQKMFVYIPKFAGRIRKIAERPFFINHSNYTESEKEKGMLERVISESVMCMFHLENWNKNGKKIASYLNENSSCEEFDVLNSNLTRLEKIITDDVKDIFNSKDSFVWLTFFDRFTKLGVEDDKFTGFLHAFKNELRSKEVDGQLFDTVDQSGSTKDKSIIKAKLHILETLLHDFLLINKEDLEEVNALDFVKENVKSDATEEDVEFYSDMLYDLTLEVDNDTKLLDKHNRPSLIALVGYVCENEYDDVFTEWIKRWFSMNNSYILNQKNNFLHMKKEFDDYLRRLKIA